jgi:hypothetical protein
VAFGGFGRVVILARIPVHLERAAIVGDLDDAGPAAHFTGRREARGVHGDFFEQKIDAETRVEIVDDADDRKNVARVARGKPPVS